MDASELELYKTQLAQAINALKSDPDNADLQNLKSELENLISLTQSLVEPADAPSQPEEESQDAGPYKSSQTHSTPQPQPQPSKGRGKEKAQFSTGQEVLARYSADRQFYPARIVAVAGDPASPTYTVVYKGYGNTEMLPGTAIKPIQPSASASNPLPPPPSNTSAPPPPLPSSSDLAPPPPPPTDPPSASSSIGPAFPSDSAPPPPASPPPPPSSFPDSNPYPPTQPPSHPSGAPIDEQARKKYRNEKKLARREEKSAIQSSKAASWQKFASTATKNKKLKHSSQSIFHTPHDDPYAKVGVTKSSSTSNSSQQKRGPQTLG